MSPRWITIPATSSLLALLVMATSNALAETGDFDLDGDVDTDDIDLLCQNIGSADPQYDLDGDGDADEDDHTFLIQNFVMIYEPPGQGTEPGDINLDGYVNATDLAIIRVMYGQAYEPPVRALSYTDGNLNCDNVVNATDLAIMKAHFGWSVPTGGDVPAPTTIALLALGASALLRRKRPTG